MKLGQFQTRYARDHYRATGRLPDIIENKPILRLHLNVYMTAFNNLSSERPIGMKAGPIPWIAIQRYAREMEFSAEQTEDIHFFVSKLDTFYLTKANGKANAS